MPLLHELKTWPRPFYHVWRGAKAFELRRHDRAFKVDDWLLLREWIPAAEQTEYPSSGSYTGRAIRAAITYILPGGGMLSQALSAEYCILSISVLSKMEAK